jgi:hypothetical protein
MQSVESWLWHAESKGLSAACFTLAWITILPWRWSKYSSLYSHCCENLRLCTSHSTSDVHWSKSAMMLQAEIPFVESHWTGWFSRSRSRSYFTTAGQSVSQHVLVSSPLWAFWLDITSCRKVDVWKLRTCFCRATSLTRGQVCSFQCNHSMVPVAQNP